ncbi:MAG: nucleotidyl transferase AbiEii/AbiGii toxin family protein [Saprospiraceae bacterium]
MLQTRTVESRTLELLKNLVAKPYLESFFLVGGTALALQMGHRVSIDLDFFTITDFDQDELLADLRKDFEVDVEVRSPSILITRIDGVKVDFVRFRYKILFPALQIEGVRMLELRDVAPMKLDAVTKRGSKKDFYDIYFLLEKMPLSEILELYAQKFEHTTIFHVIKSLTYFDDAEEQPDPIVFEKKHTWEMVKTTLGKAAQKIYR